MWYVDPLLSSESVNIGVARQRPQHTRSQQHRRRVFCVRGRAVAMQRARCDVTQQ
jgi:hypothetical protein